MLFITVILEYLLLIQGDKVTLFLLNTDYELRITNFTLLKRLPIGARL